MDIAITPITFSKNFKFKNPAYKSSQKTEEATVYVTLDDTTEELANYQISQNFLNAAGANYNPLKIYLTNPN